MRRQVESRRRLVSRCARGRRSLRCCPPTAVALFGLALLAGCDSAPSEIELDFLTALTVTPDPSGHAPLTAEIVLRTSRPVAVEVVVTPQGIAGEERRDYGPVSQTARLPLLGLFHNRANTVTLRFTDPDGALLGATSFVLTTPPLLRDLPSITVDVAAPAAMQPGMNLVSYFGHAGQFVPQRPFIFDANGRIRWYLDFGSHPTLANLFYDNGVQRLANGNLYFGDGSSGRIIEMDMLGRIVRTWALSGYGFHHQVLELPSGNFLVTVNKTGAPTVEDFLIELDRQSGAVVREWDLNQSLDNTRRAWPTDLADLDVDWFHANGVAYDPADGGVIVSGRTQGTVKLTPDNAVVWILGMVNSVRGGTQVEDAGLYRVRSFRPRLSQTTVKCLFGSRECAHAKVRQGMGFGAIERRAERSLDRMA